MRPARWQVALALCIGAAAGCNLVLGNDKRSLAVSTTDPYPPDGGPTAAPPPEDAAVDSDADTRGSPAPAPDAGPMMTTDPRPEAGPAPMECASPDHLAECVPGMLDTQMLDCGPCDRGKQTRMRMCGETCGWGPFSPWSECRADAEACEPGKVQERVGKCGPCEKDRLVSRRTCTASCGWSDWSAEVCEPDPLYCTPGVAKALPDMPCGQRCGVIQQTQTCSAACTWNAVVKTACMEVGICMPGETKPAPDAPCNPDYCNKGVQPQIQRCSSTCEWAPATANGGCTIPDNVCRPADLQGKGHRCRPNDSGFGDVCNPSTASAALRCTFGARQRFADCP